MKMKHDNLWRANPDTAEEMDEIERRRKRAMRTAITLLALAVAVNVAVNEFSCLGLIGGDVQGQGGLLAVRIGAGLPRSPPVVRRGLLDGGRGVPLGRGRADA